jgi:hypothetical protein
VAVVGEVLTERAAEEPGSTGEDDGHRSDPTGQVHHKGTRAVEDGVDSD